MDEFISKKQLREFGILIGFLFPIIIGLIIPKISGHSFKLWTIFIGAPLIFIGLIKPIILLIPYKGWMKLGFYLGWINSRIILGLVFIVVLQPISLIMKITGYDPLRQKTIKSNTYKEKKENHKIDLTKIF